MPIHIAAIGADKNSPTASLTEDYIKRLKAYQPTQLHILPVSKLQTPQQRKQAEMQNLLKTCPNNAVKIVLTERGKNISTQQLSQTIQTWLNNGQSTLWFALGGPDGHDTQLEDMANLKLSLGALTLPHLLARTVLAEQLYRVFSLLAGHPYHRS